MKSLYILSFSQIHELLFTFLEDCEILNEFTNELSISKEKSIHDYLKDRYDIGGVGNCYGIIDTAFSWHNTNAGYAVWLSAHENWQKYLKLHVKAADDGKPFEPIKKKKLYKSIW